MPINKDTFCVAPWFSIFLDSKGKLAPCCKFADSQLNYDQIDRYFSSNELNDVRSDLLKGVKNKNCAKCWKDEQNGGDSLRLISNRTTALHGDIKISEQIKNPQVSKIKSFDLTLGNLCNLKCVMCSPGLSSQLLAEAKLNPNLDERYNAKFEQKDFNWPDSEDFVKWCEHYLPQAIHIKFTGGEPFLLPWLHKVIATIPDKQKAKCILHFTTNLTKIDDKLFGMFKKFKATWISVSVEGIGQTHEYLRYGHSWNLLTGNIQSILKKKIDNLIFKINHVVQAPSYHSIIKMTEFFDSISMQIHPILLSKPEHFHISALTREAKEEFIEATNRYSGHNQKFIHFVRSVSLEYIDQNEVLTKACIRDLEILDSIRQNNYTDIIPEKNLRLY